MKSLEVAFARRLNRLAGERGPVFAERYHARILRTPTQARNALNYVLGNEARHRGGTEIAIDPFSSAKAFAQWRSLRSRPPRFVQTAWSEPEIEAWYGEILREARTWLLRVGWMRGGRPSVPRRSESGGA